jgi:hypothetical protein
MAKVICDPAFLDLEHPAVLRAMIHHILGHAHIEGIDPGGRPIMTFSFPLEPWMLDKLTALGAAGSVTRASVGVSPSRRGQSAPARITSMRWCNCCTRSLAVVIAVRDGIVSPAGERQISRRPARTVSLASARPIAKRCLAPAPLMEAVDHHEAALPGLPGTTMGRGPIDRPGC